MAERSKEEILIHICCAPCFCEPRRFFEKERISYRGLFFNPNIHPLLEFRRRLKSIRVLTEQERIPLETVEEYGLVPFLRQVSAAPQKRCLFCYRTRLEETARHAQRLGIEAFTTTLLLSPFQKHELLRELGEEIGKESGIRFYYRDFRPLFERSWNEAKRRSLYRQQYCGCVYSEFDRYKNTSLHLYKGPK